MSDEVVVLLGLMTQLSKKTLDVLEEIKAAQASEASSSVQIATSTRGYDVTVKAYVGSNVRSAGDQAMDEWLRVHAEIGRRLMDQAA